MQTGSGPSEKKSATKEWIKKKKTKQKNYFVNKKKNKHKKKYFYIFTPFRSNISLWPASCSGKEIETQIELIYGDNKTNCQNRLHAVAVLCCTNAAA